MAQRLLRHCSPATTAGYLHPILDDLEAALEPLEIEATVQFVGKGFGLPLGLPRPNLT